VILHSRRARRGAFLAIIIAIVGGVYIGVRSGGSDATVRATSSVFTIPSKLPPRAHPTVSRSAVLSAADRVSFRRLAAALPGPEGVAISAVGRHQPVSRLGSLTGGSAWSTAKAPVAMAVVAAGNGSAQRANLVRAITASDNAAAENLWASLGGGDRAARAADAQLRAAGDRHTKIESRRLLAGYTPFGQTNWSLADQTRFTAGMGCTGAGVQVLRLMGEVIRAQRWGLGAVARARLKGGWGPGTQPGVTGGWMERQMGVLAIKGRPVAVTIASSPGGHEQGVRNLTELTRWVVAHADTSRFPRSATC
jgi:hypothetical protein